MNYIKNITKLDQLKYRINEKQTVSILTWIGLVELLPVLLSALKSLAAQSRQKLVG
ncbi:hypothetical protein D3C73_1534330 [compost metagenome]